MRRALAAVAVIVAIVVVVTAAYVLTRDDDGDIVYKDTGNSLDVYSTDGNVVTECRFQHIGFAFIGWNTSAEGSGTWHMPGDTVDVSNGQVILYAQWAPCVFDYRLGTATDPGTVNGLIHLVYGDGTSTELAQGALMWKYPRVVVSDEIWTWETGDGDSDFVGTDASGNRCDLTVLIACGDNDVQKLIVDGEPTYTFEVHGGTVVVVSATVTPAGTFS